jgi:hypothetical protein
MRINNSVICVVFALAHCSVAMRAQPRHSNLIELFTDNQGMYFPAGRTLYAIIRDDGRMEYLVGRDMRVKYKELTPSEVATINRLIQSKEVSQFSGTINAAHQDPHQDYQTNLEVSIQRKGTVQHFVLQGFEPDDGRQFPADFEKLICFVDLLRAADYRISSDCR